MLSVPGTIFFLFVAFFAVLLLVRLAGFPKRHAEEREENIKYMSSVMGNASGNYMDNYYRQERRAAINRDRLLKNRISSYYNQTEEKNDWEPLN